MVGLGYSAQIQSYGRLLRDGSLAFSNAAITPDGYLSFGVTGPSGLGASGYGLRDNAGVIQYKNNGGAWQSFPTGGAAPDDATYLLQTPNAALTSAQAMSALGSGLVFSTTATGVQSTVASVATGQVLVSNGVGAAPVYSASPSVTSILIGGITTLSASVATFGTSISIPNGGGFFWSSRAYFGSPADSIITLGNNSATTGVRLNAATNGTLWVKSFADADTAIVKASQFVGTAIPAIGANTGQILLLKSDGTFTTDGTTLTWDSSSDLMSVNGLNIYANGVRSAGGVDVSLGTANSGGNVYVKGSTGAVSINSAGYTYANRPSVSNGYGYAIITDSNTDTWGATVAGGGAFKILAFYNGTNWTVAGK